MACAHATHMRRTCDAHISPIPPIDVRMRTSRLGWRKGGSAAAFCGPLCAALPFGNVRNLEKGV